MMDTEDSFLDETVFANLYSEVRKRTLGEFFFIENDDENLALNKLKNLSETKFLKLLEKIYDKSKIFGQQIVKNQSETYSTDQIIAFLNKTDIPCMSSGWKLLDDDSSYRRFRTNCPDTVCNRRCTYWREAVKGLIAGLGDSTKFARHRSLGHGDQMCVDLIYDSDFADQKFGNVTEEIEEVIKPIREKFAKNNVRLILDGYSEGVLYYRFVGNKSDLEPLRYNILREVLQLTFLEKLPNVILFETNSLYH